MLLGAAPAQVVQTLNMCFTVGKGSQVLTLAAAGALSSATWAAVAGLTLPSVAALVAGMRVRDRIDAQTYRAWLRKALWVMVVLLLAAVLAKRARVASRCLARSLSTRNPRRFSWS